VSTGTYCVNEFGAKFSSVSYTALYTVLENFVAGGRECGNIQDENAHDHHEKQTTNVSHFH